MIKIRRRYGRVKGQHAIYKNVEEAHAHGITEVVPWQEAGAGQWALSDDGYVVQCIHRARLKRAARLTFSVGRVFTNAAYNVGAFLASGNYAYSAPKTDRLKQEMGRRRFKAMIRTYAQMLLLKGDIDEAKLGRILDPKARNAVRRVRYLLAHPRVQPLIAAETRNVLDDTGVDELWVVQAMKSALDGAEAKGDYRTMLRVLESFAKMLDLYPRRH